MEAPTPLRPDEEVAGRYISATLGGQVKRLPVLSIARNRDWKQKYDEMVVEVGASAESDDFEEVVRVLSDGIDKFLDLLMDYDETGALGGREWIEANATDKEVYDLFGIVKNAAYPFGIDLMARVLGEIRLNMARLAAGSKSTSSSLPSTGGSPTSSRAA